MSKFKKLRKQRRISVAELSRLSGISKRTLEKYENGEREINKARAIAVYNIAKALNCSIEDLLDLEDKRKDMVVKMTKYELFKLNNEISWKNRYGMLPGCSIDLNGSQDPEKIEEFQTKEEALEALKKYSTSVGEGSGFFSITEYYVSEIEYDDDGVFLNEDILEYSKMNIEVIEKPSYNVLASFDNYKDAEDFKNSYDGENEVYISLP